MKTSSDRILTTHTGSLPRPASLTGRHDRQAVRAAVQDVVRRRPPARNPPATWTPHLPAVPQIAEDPAFVEVPVPGSSPDPPRRPDPPR